MLFEAILWGLFPIVTIISLNSLHPLYSASFTFFVSSLFFLGMIAFSNKWKNFFDLESLKYVLIATLFIGILFYGLTFYGYQFTTAGNGSLVSLMEVFFTFFILSVIMKVEPISFRSIIGALTMVVGAGMILFQGSLHVNKGTLIIMLATIFPPIGNYYMQKARKKVSSYFILFIRNIFSGIFLLILALLFVDMPSFSDVQISIPILLINGIILFGISKILWIEGIHRIPITRAISLNTSVPAFTLIFAFFILKEIPNLWQLTGLIPLVTGAWLILNKKN